MRPQSSVGGLGDPAPRSILGDAPTPAMLARAPGQGGGCPQPPEWALGRGKLPAAREGSGQGSWVPSATPTQLSPDSCVQSGVGGKPQELVGLWGLC